MEGKWKNLLTINKGNNMLYNIKIEGLIGDEFPLIKLFPENYESLEHAKKDTLNDLKNIADGCAEKNIKNLKANIEIWEIFHPERKISFSFKWEKEASNKINNQQGE